MSSSFAFTMITAMQQTSVWEQYVTWRTSFRLLPPPPAGWTGASVCTKLSGYPLKQSIYKLRFEAAGAGFEALILRKIRGEPESEEPQIDDATRAHAEQKRRRHRTGSATAGQQTPTESASTALTEDPYELLGLGHLRWRATEEHIKKAYRKQVLIHHPDKKGGASLAEDDVDEMFKSLTRAHDTLSDPRKRREFDSTEPFDDYIPSELIKIETEQQFFNTYASILDRNAKWSKVQPVPLLGEPDMPYEKVMEFYDFWMSFRSWRSFACEEEFDPEDAESREEKRWMERQNERERKRRKREELSRVASLVEGAFKRDPRIKRHKAAEKEAKRQATQAKHDAVRRAREEEERKENEEREAIEKAAKAKAEEEAKERQRRANAQRDARAKLRKICRSAGASLKAPTTDVELLCSTLAVERLKALTEAIKSGGSGAQAAFDAEVRSLKKESASEEKREAEQQEQEQQAKAAEEEKKKKGPSVWTDDELHLLAQGVAKFPGGTPNRWRMIADLINQKADRGAGARVKARSVQDIIAKASEIKDVGEKSAVAGVQMEDHKHKGVKVQKINVGGPIGGISLRTQIPDLAAASSSSSSSSSTEHEANNGGEKAAAAASSATPSDWTQDQQKALEAALKKFPASLGVQRWDSISAAVAGKSKKECVERYKFIVAQLRGKTGGK